MKQFILMGMLLTTVVALVFVSGCATTRGIGTDIKNLGQGIENAAE